MSDSFRDRVIADLKRNKVMVESKVTREMINAAHGVTLQKGDVILSADLLERIYLAMDARREFDDTYFDGDTDDLHQYSYRAAYNAGVEAAMSIAYGMGDEQMYEQLKGLKK